MGGDSAVTYTLVTSDVGRKYNLEPYLFYSNVLISFSVFIAEFSNALCLVSRVQYLY